MIHLLCFAFCTSAWAQAPGDADYAPPAIQADPWRTPVDARLAGGVEDASFAAGSVGMVELRQTADPLVYTRGEQVTRLVGDVTTARLASAWSGERLRVGLTVPVILRLTSDLQAGWLTAVGDPTIDTKAGLFEGASGTRLAVVGRLSLPFGAAAHQLGHRSPTLAATAVLEQPLGPLFLLVNAGGALAQGEAVGPDTLGSALHARAALGWLHEQGWGAFAELHANTRFQGWNTSPIEWNIGARGPLTVGSTTEWWVSGGGPLNRGIGAPTWQAAAGLRVRQARR